MFNKNRCIGFIIFIFIVFLLASCGGSERQQQYFHVDDLIGKRVGVPVAFGADFVITEMGVHKITRSFFGVDLPILLKSGNIDAYVIERSAAEIMVTEVPGLVILPEVVGDEFYTIISHRENFELGKAVDAALGEIMADPVFDEMIERWLYGGLLDVVMPDIPAGTGEALIVGVFSQYPPFLYFGIGGERMGFEAELIKRLAFLLDREIVYFETEYDSLFTGVDAGIIDIAVSVIYDTPALRERYFASRTYFNNELVMVVLGDSVEMPNFIERIINSVNKHLFIDNRYTYILEGLLNTLIITAIAIVGGTLLGALLCALIRGRRVFLRRFANFYVRMIQGTPVIILLMLCIYVIFAGLKINSVVLSGIAFSFYFAANICEVLRACLDAIDKGQIEAAKAIGFNNRQVYKLVLIPQLLVLCLPIYCANLVEMIKLTAVVGYVGVMDLTYSVEVIRSRTYESIFPLLLEMVIYIIITSFVAGIFRLILKKIDPVQKSRRIRI